MPSQPAAPHAVARLHAERKARSAKPFLARGGTHLPRCAACRLPLRYCLCAQCATRHATHAGVCLLMHDAEPLKPTNTGWLVADAVADTFAFGWARTAVDPALLALLADPQWQPFVVFPPDGLAPERVRHAALPQPCAELPGHQGAATRRPLFVLLDGTWSEASKMFRKSPYLDRFPVLSLQPDAPSRYGLRHASNAAHLCTAEVAALCLQQSGDVAAAHALRQWLAAFSRRYLQARRQLVPDAPDAPDAPSTAEPALLLSQE